MAKIEAKEEARRLLESAIVSKYYVCDDKNITVIPETMYFLARI